MTDGFSIQFCSKCMIILGADHLVLVASAIGHYGVVNQPLPDNNCPGGIGGHDVGLIGHSSYRNIKKSAALIFCSGVAFIFLTITKCIYELVSNYHTLQSNTTFNAFDICSFVVVSLALLLWITQRVEMCKFDLLWTCVANCFSRSSTRYFETNQANCIFDGALLCVLDGIMKITFVKMVRRLFIGILSTTMWNGYYLFSQTGFCVFFSYWILDIFLCYYEWTRAPDGKLCCFNPGNWNQHVASDYNSHTGCYCCFQRVCVVASQHRPIPVAPIPQHDDDDDDDQ